MPHADASFVPEDIKTKAAFYEHVELSIRALTEGQDYWVSNLANASSVLYNSYLGSALYGRREDGEPIVNWCGFYIHPPENPESKSGPLLLGPFCGRPACQLIQTKPGRGVCADAFLKNETLVVGDVDAYPGHIACDASSQSEIVLPLLSRSDGSTIGVLDLDSTVKHTFDDEDKAGLERIVNLLKV